MKAGMIFLLRVFCLLLTFCAITFAQELGISGEVRDLNTHKQISNVNIFVKETQIGTTTDDAGKFTLSVDRGSPQTVIVFRHIAYEALNVSVHKLMNMKYIYLQPRVIPLRGVTIEEEGVQMEIRKDLPQPVAVMDARDFEIRGYVDAGDLLRNDQSIQIEEELSGKKTVSIRGGNPDEVVVLYNNVKMNSAYDNIFDLSLIDLEDVERFEIIKGSNTALYGPEAFSGVINIVPKLRQDYTIRFQQRLGTYRSGNWGLHFFKQLGGLHGSFSIRRGGAKRTFVDLDGENDRGLQNNSSHYTGNLSYTFSEDDKGKPANVLSAMAISTTLDYDNLRDNEFLDNRNEMFSLKYAQESGVFSGLVITISHRMLDEKQILFIPDGDLERKIDDQSSYFNVEKQIQLGRFEILTSYQFQRASLDFRDRILSSQVQQVGLESAELIRNHHGFVTIAKLSNELDSEFLQSFDINLSLRHDRVKDKQNDAVLRGDGFENTAGNEAGIFGNNAWNETIFKFSVGMSGYRDYLSLNGYLNFGNNVKFPTLFQQISSPLTLTSARFTPNLNPEKNRSIEIGFNLTKEFRGRPAVYGWGFSGNFFQNHYDNKFRLSVTPGIPVPFYDNVLDARISGVEGKTSLYLYRKKVTLQYGVSRYNISEKAAFPFKAEFKHTFDFLIDHAGYAFQLHWFRESEQVGWLRLASDQTTPSTGYSGFGEIELPGYSNLDLHLSKKFEIFKLKLFLNFSGRNLLNSKDVLLEGLAIRDRRLYVTMGAQY